jgi:pimeloyl-ACP methyl ester carboxylesterase
VSRTRHFEHEGHRLVFDEYGSGDRPVLLMPGLLLSRRMHGPLAATLAERGYRVLCLDPLGHGDGQADGDVALLDDELR